MKKLLLILLGAAAIYGTYALTSSTGDNLTVAQKRQKLIDLTSKEGSQAAKPFYKMSDDEINACYKFMFYYQDILNNGKNKIAMPDDFKAIIAAVAKKWNIFT